MKDDVRDSLVGALALTVLAGTLGLSYGGGQLKDDPRYPILATFNRIDGLAAGAEVHLGGIRVGTVAGQRLTDSYRAEIAMRIDPAVKLPLDTSAAIHTDGLFGAKYITLEPGGEDRMLAPGGRIKLAQDSLVVEDLLDMIIAQGKDRRARQGAEKGAEKGAEAVKP